MSTASRRLRQADLFRVQNQNAAQIILRRPARYAGLPVIWARAVMAKGLIAQEDSLKKQEYLPFS